MLDVAVIMFTVNKIGENYKMVISLCFYNPFAGDGGKRWPETKCFNISNQNTELGKIDEFLSSRLSNLHQHKLRIDIYDYHNSCKPVKDAKGRVTRYEYVDGDTIFQLSQKLNFESVGLL